MVCPPVAGESLTIHRRPNVAIRQWPVPIPQPKPIPVKMPRIRSRCQAEERIRRSMAIPPSVRDLFAPAPGITYLDAATVGLPPKPTVDALERALQMWQNGSADWAKDWDTEGDACRDLFATLIGASAEEIGLVPTVSAGVGIVAASIPQHAEVLVPEGEFPSVLYPF